MARRVDIDSALEVLRENPDDTCTNAEFADWLEELYHSQDYDCNEEVRLYYEKQTD